MNFSSIFSRNNISFHPIIISSLETCSIQLYSKGEQLSIIQIQQICIDCLLYANYLPGKFLGWRSLVQSLATVHGATKSRTRLSTNAHTVIKSNLEIRHSKRLTAIMSRKQNNYNQYSTKKLCECDLSFALSLKISDCTNLMLFPSQLNTYFFHLN